MTQFLRVACRLLTVTTVVVGIAGCNQYQKDGAPNDKVSLDEIKPITAKYEPISRGGNRTPYNVLGKTYHLLPTNKGYREEGIASWYGTKFHGNKTSNGELYDMRTLSAAHRSLPIPTYLKVTNLKNNRSVVVRVNDRGPFHSERIIDLSYAAALMLDFADRGTASVLLESIDFNQPGAALDSASLDGAPMNDYLQVGAFSRAESAQVLKKRIEEWVDHPVEVKQENDSNRSLYRVYVGPFTDSRLLVQVKQELYNQGIEQSHRVPVSQL